MPPETIWVVLVVLAYYGALAAWDGLQWVWARSLGPVAGWIGHPWIW